MEIAKIHGLTPARYLGKVCDSHPEDSRIKHQARAHVRRREACNRTLGLSQSDPRFVTLRKLARKLGRVIDHHYPINGKTVSGLHVPWNMRLVTSEQNIAKSNKHPQQFYKGKVT